MKFWMYSGLITDCAERASRELCEGARVAARGTNSETVISSLKLATVSEMEMFSSPFAASCRPVLRAVAKPGDDTSIVYVPTANPETAKRPSGPVSVERTAPLKSFFAVTSVFGTTFPSGSKTTPDIVAKLPVVCACEGRDPAIRSATETTITDTRRQTSREFRISPPKYQTSN